MTVLLSVLALQGGASTAQAAEPEEVATDTCASGVSFQGVAPGGDVNGAHFRITAGHCPDLTNVISSAVGGPYDFAIHAVDRNEPGGYYATEYATADDLWVGLTLCSSGGGATGPRCGTIQRLDYTHSAASYIPNGYGFILLDAPCQAGDSGEAWHAPGEDTQGKVYALGSGRLRSTGQCLLSAIPPVVAANPWLLDAAD